jgi:fructokinase
MTDPAPIFGCVEAGGTKFVLGLARSPETILETIRLDTISPDKTIGETIAWFNDAVIRHGPIAAIGIASFGPVELDRNANNWGCITTTTKPGWSDSDFAGRVQRELNVPVGFDTDVNGAALAEARWGAGIDQRVSIYVTVGTGIGGGAIVDGTPLRGLSHPEMGHFRPARHVDDMNFAGVCPFHGDCLEGLASGPAIKARWGASLSELDPGHAAHSIIAWYLAQMVVTLQSFTEPGRIILGGGVLATPGLLERVRAQAAELGGGYFRGDAQSVIVAPGLGEHSGLLGGLALAMDAAQHKAISNRLGSGDD